MTPLRRLSRIAASLVALATLAGVAAAQDWVLDYGPGTVHSARPTAAGGWIVGGEIEMGTRTSGLVFEIDAAGAVRWAWTLTTPGGNPYDCLITTVMETATGFVAMGFRQFDSRGPFLAGFTPTGDLAWQRQLQSYPSHPIASLDVADDGTLVIGSAWAIGESAVVFLSPAATNGRVTIFETGDTLPSGASARAVGSSVLATTRTFFGAEVMHYALLETDGSMSWVKERPAWPIRSVIVDDNFDAFELTAVPPFAGSIQPVPWPGGGSTYILNDRSGTARLVVLDALGAVERSEDVVLHGGSPTDVRGAGGPSGALLWTNPDTWLPAAHLTLAHVSPGGVLPPACADVSPAPPIEPRLGAVVLAPSSLTIRSGSVTLVPYDLVPARITLTPTCPGCVPLECREIRTSSSQPCSSRERLTVVTVGGEGTLDFEWDFDGDGVTDATGSPVDVPPLLAPPTVTVTVTDDCGLGAQTCTLSQDITWRAPPAEVSDVLAGAPPLTLTAPDVLLVEDVSGATGYRIYTGAIGSWYGGSRACSATVIQRLGGFAWLRVPTSAPPSAWLLVTAVDRNCEGIAGTDSFGSAREDDPTWQRCP